MNKSTLFAVAVCALFVSCGSIHSAEAAGDNTCSAEKGYLTGSDQKCGIIEFEELPYETLNIDFLSGGDLTTDISRATSRIEWDIPAGKIMKADIIYSLEADETVTIHCTYSPRTADVDFGLLTPDGTFRFISGSSGIVQATIRVNEAGTYQFAARNNSDNVAEVLGYVYY